MVPLIARIRETAECAVAIQPVPYRTDAIAPTMETLCSPNGERASAALSRGTNQNPGAEVS
jgi:hypothetical protein